MKLISQKGFTLSELLIYIVLVAVLSTAVSSIFIAILRGQSQVEVRSDVNSNLRFAIEKISQDLRKATAVTTPGTAGATDNTLIMTVSGSTITYCVAANRLRRQEGGTCDSNSVTVTMDSVNITTPTPPFKRLENLTGAPLNKTVISIQIDLTASNAATASEKTFSANKKTTISLY